MYPVLHAVSRLIECPRSDRRGLTDEVADALADEAGLSMATRLGLVALASRIEAEGPGERTRHWLRSFSANPERSLQLRDHVGGAARVGTLADSYLPALLETLSRAGEPQAIEALVACAPALREIAEALGRRRDPYALLPVALLELLASRLH